MGRFSDVASTSLSASRSILKRSVPYARRLRFGPAPRRELFSIPYLKEKAPVIETPVTR